MGSVYSELTAAEPSGKEWRRKVDTAMEPDIVDLAGESQVKLSRDAKQILLQDLGKLLETGEASDVVLQAGDRTFQAHRAVLAARSPAFGVGVLRVCNAKDEIRVPDADGAAVEALLAYLYKGAVPEVTEQNLAPLMRLAERYKLGWLARYCRAHVFYLTSAANFCDVLGVGLDSGNAYVVHVCKVFFRENIGSAVETQQWKAFAERNPAQANALLTETLFRPKQIVAQSAGGTPY